MDYTYHYASPLGGVTLASDGEALTGLWFDGQKHFASTLSAAPTERALPVFAQAERWLETYFSGREPEFTPPLHLRDTAFRVTVWECLRTVPYGQTLSYGDLAQRLGLPRSAARAVGGAVGRNPISLILPCHRIVGADGALTGYAGGLDRKRQLLAMERA